MCQAAQDKEELQREGDELDARIRKAEREIRALENTLKLMNSRNETYRKSFNKVTDTSEFSPQFFCCFYLSLKTTLQYCCLVSLYLAYFHICRRQCINILTFISWLRQVCGITALKEKI